MSNLFRDNVYESFPDPSKQIEQVENQLTGNTKKLSNIVLDIASEYNLPIYSEGFDIDTALQAAFGKLNKGGKILLPKGTFYASPFSMPPQIIIQGVGQESTILKMKNGKNTDFITFDQAAYAGVNNLTVHANSENNNAGCGIVIKNSQVAGKDNSRNLDIQMIRVMYAQDHGIKILAPNVWIFQLRNIKIDGCNGYGIYNTATDNSFYGIDVFACKKGGIFEAGNNNRWVGGKLYVNGDVSYPSNAGFTLSGAKRIQVVGVEVQDDRANGFLIKDSSDCTLTGILSDGNGSLSQNNLVAKPPYADGIKIANSHGITVQGTSSSYIPCQRKPLTIDATSYKVTVLLQGDGNSETAQIDSQAQINVIDNNTQANVSSNTKSIGVPYVKKEPVFSVNNVESAPTFSTLTTMKGLNVSSSGAGTAKKLNLTAGNVPLANNWTIEWDMEFSQVASSYPDFLLITFGDSTQYKMTIGSAFGYSPAMYLQSSTYTTGIKANEQIVANKLYRCSLVRTPTTITLYVNGLFSSATATVNEPAAGIASITFQADVSTYSYAVRNVLVSSRAKPSYEISNFTRDSSTLFYLPLQSDLSYGKGIQSMISDSVIRLKSPGGKFFDIKVDDSGVITATQA